MREGEGEGEGRKVEEREGILKSQGSNPLPRQLGAEIIMYNESRLRQLFFFS